MPIYDYRCESCGPFTGIGKMDDALNDIDCPQCGSISKRVIKAPYLACMSSDNRSAWEKNEASAHQPKTRRSSCGCTGAHTCNTGSTNTGKPALQQSVKKNSRPWMLGH